MPLYPPETVNHNATLSGDGSALSPLAVVGFAGGVVRLIASGSSTVAANTLSTVATVTRNAGELLWATIFCTDATAGAQFAPDRSSLLGAATDVISLFFERTTNANEFLVRVRNNNAPAGPSRTLDWRVYGIV